MAFKIGGTTIADNSANIKLNTNNGEYVGGGIYFNNGVVYDQSKRYYTYTDDLSNCRGYLPAGNCLGNGLYYVPNGDWWTWGVGGVPTGLCGNPSGFDFAGGTSSAYYPVAVSTIYDAYYMLCDRIRGIEYHRNYSHCNCNNGYNSVGNCYNNCNCNCACVCDCNCNCNCYC